MVGYQRISGQPNITKICRKIHQLAIVLTMLLTSMELPVSNARIPNAHTSIFRCWHAKNAKAVPHMMRRYTSA